MNTIKFLTFIYLSTLVSFVAALPLEKTNQYNLVVNHPGEKKAIEIVITQILNEEDFPVSYYMDVPSVICYEQVCKIIPVKLFWNNLGEYQIYELEPQSTLEKYKADSFEPKDYIKLDRILSNKHSPFKDVLYHQILTSPDDNDVDAVSGATALILDDEDTVPGAALGCYTLWHWANGEIVDKIKNLTGKSFSEKQLKDLLSEDKKHFFPVVIQELSKRNNYLTSFVELVIQKTLEEKILIQQSIEYLEKSPQNVYYASMEKIFIKGNENQKIHVLRSLMKSNYTLERPYLSRLSNHASSLKSLQEVSLFLEVVQLKNPVSEVVIKNIFPLLKSDLVIARSVYWFLKNQKTTVDQEEELKIFHEQNKDKL